MRPSFSPYLAAALFLTAAVALAFSALRIGLPPWACALAALAAAVLAWPLARIAGGPAPARLDPGSLAIVGLAVVWVVVLFGSGVLPPGDPIAVPQFARELAQGRLLTQAYPAGSSAHAYPPGLPLLLAPLAAGLDPVHVLLAFKVATLAAVALIPAGWAWLYRRLFEPPVAPWLLTALAYGAFFVLERTLGFATPFAGKNALLVALLLFPAVAGAIIALARDARLFLMALPAYGLALIHYSMLHLLAAFLAAYVVSGLALRRLGWPEAARVLAVGLFVVAAFLAANSEVLTDPRAAALAWRPLDGAAEAVRLLLAERPTLVIFHDAAFGVLPSPWRGLQLLTCAAIAGAAAWRLQDRALGHAAATFLLGLLASLAFAYGVIPAGINLDFVRWYAWPLQAGLFLAALLAVFLAWRASEGRARRIGQAAALLAVPALGVVALWDGYVERSAFRATAVPQPDLAAVEARLPDRGPCFLVGESTANPTAMVTTQRFPAWAYAEALSPCQYVNGSWVQPGRDGGRELDGFPAPEALAALPDGAPLLFVGSPEAFNRYDARLRAAGLALAWRPEPASTAGAAVWRVPAP